jgi:hypothetical protein
MEQCTSGKILSDASMWLIKIEVALNDRPINMKGITINDFVGKRVINTAE